MQLGQPVTFASRALTLAERKYSQIWKELLAQVFGMDHNHHHDCVCSEGHPLDRSQTISLHCVETSGISFQETTAPTVAASTIWLWNTLQAWQGDAASWYPVRAFSEDYERSATESEVECIHATHSFLFQTTTLTNFRERRLVIQLYSLVKKAILDGFLDTMDEQPAAIHRYRISSNNSWGRLFLFSHKNRAIIRGKAIIWGRLLCQCISNIAHWKSCPKYFVLFSH